MFSLPIGKGIFKKEKGKKKTTHATPTTKLVGRSFLTPQKNKGEKRL